MANCSDTKNPLRHNGTARSERLLSGMQQDYVKVDEKNFADWIVFAKEFSKYINYYELNGAQNGNWSVFFSNDVSAVLGSIAIQDADAYKREIKNRFDFLKDDDSETQVPAVKRKLNDLFSAIVSFCESLDNYYRQVPPDTALKQLIENVIKVNLSSPLKSLLQYYEAARDLNLLISDIPAGWTVLSNQVKDASVIINGNGLNKLWWGHFSTPAVPLTSWAHYYASIVTNKDESIFGIIADEYVQINRAANHNLFAAIFQQFLMGYSRLVTAAEKELLASIEKQNDHAPHYALFLAFLRLFRLAQDDMNTITQRHLDFYYKEILQLKERPALPNSTHVITELAKPVENYLLQKNTLFKAGKDSEGREVLYALNSETTYNKAAVKSLRAIYFATAANGDKVTDEARLFAAPIINSADGNSAELTTANKEWHPFANRLFSDGVVTGIAMPKAEIGFAVASHYLYLQEGKREVIISIYTSNTNIVAGKRYAVYITAAKGWHKVAESNSVAQAVSPDYVNFSFKLKGGDPAITNYNAEKHGGSLNVNVPVVKILLVNDGSIYEYGNTTATDTLRNVTVSQIKIEVKVGMDTTADNIGVKQLQVITNAGPVDVSKPFMPFGPQPVRDNSFIIGNKEIFSKKNASIILNIKWAGITPFTAANVAFPANTGFPSTKFDFLEGGSWTNKTPNLAVFNVANPEAIMSSIAENLPDTTLTDFRMEYNSYGAESANGFMRLVLNNGFGHAAHQLQLAKHLIGQSKTPPETSAAFSDPGIQPYIPLIQSLTISYSANSGVINLSYPSADILSGVAQTNYKQQPVSFFHLYPFGDAEQHSFLNKETIQFLLPQFSHKNDTGFVQHEAEFYIGLQNLAPHQSLNILFQVMDGTANPEEEKPGDHIHWSYLGNNQWKSFNKQAVNDGTLGLIQSGIIQFIIPADGTITNTVMPAGYLWVKASVNKQADAVCKLISVNAQAALVTFKDNSNAGSFLNTALPAASISKLKIPQAEVKKISQPYSSFGGKPAETSDAFYIRVSERLRHKERAITIWDYEHLILEAFPLIHKVKCLNHTKSTDTDYNEVVPGHVTIITIPDLKQRDDINPLRPYTSQAVLKAIDIFLRKKISCHVQLHVVNPVFEEVKMKFNLKLAKGFDDYNIYKAKLKEEITAFLSPWAYGRGEISFGGKIYKSVLINFIEERPYVDFIIDVEMAHISAKGIEADNDEITATTSKGILVSVPASGHEIGDVPDTATEQQLECDYLQRLQQ